MTHSVDALWLAPNDASGFATLGSMAMATKKFGPMVIRALVPRHFKDLTAVQLATGFAYSTIHDWSTGKSNPKLDQLEVIAAKIGRDVTELLGGSSTGVGALRSHVEFAETFKLAREQHPSIPEWAWHAAADTYGGRMPEKLTPSFLANLAAFWMANAPDSDVERAFTDAAKRDLERARRRK